MVRQLFHDLVFRRFLNGDQASDLRDFFGITRVFKGFSWYKFLLSDETKAGSAGTQPAEGLTVRWCRGLERSLAG